MKKLYITTPLYYVNAKPHIGHSYTQVICDAIARFHKQSGNEVFFMTGTDEHGEKIEKATLEAGFSKGDEKKFVDSIVVHFKELWEKLDIKYDHFIRTTDKVHEDTVKKVLSILHEKNKLYKKAYKGYFCTPCETFWSSNQASDGLCPDCKRSLEKLDEENYFFKISEYKKELIEYIKKNPEFIIPEIRRNEVLSFLEKNELQDLCISRPKKRLSWGIELPFDKEFVTYVWFDALINYISGIGYVNDRKKFDTFWPSATHVIGKDILRHHAIYWPIMLFAIGEKVPEHILTHGWWVIKGEKMSKSKGNAIDPMEIIGKYGVDAFRYFLLSAVVFGYDGTFSEELFITKYNNDLANDLGNLLNRTLTMVEKYFDGIVPKADPSLVDNEIREGVMDLPAEVDSKFTLAGSSALALNVIWSLINKANKHIEKTAPWKLAKENTEMLKAVIYELTQVLGIAAVCLYPFMPASSKNIWEQLGMTTDLEALKVSDSDNNKERFWNTIKPGTRINKGKPLFPRILSK